VAAFLTWAQWLREAVLPWDNTVVINIDETAMSRLVTGRRGNVAHIAQGSRAVPYVYERADTRLTHAHTTVVAAICNDATLQATLPQIILPRDQALSRVEKEALGGVAPPLTWLRGSAGWVSTRHMKTVLTMLRRSIHTMRPGCHILLVMDAASQHLAADVVAHAARLHIMILVLPARLTWLLQPLDTHVFAPLKRALVAAQQATRAEHAEGSLAPAEWVRHLDTAIRRVLVDRAWAHALDANGVLGSTAALRTEVQAHASGSLPLPLRPPTRKKIDLVLGRHRRGLHEALLRAPLMLVSARAGGVAPRLLVLCPCRPPTHP